jgi:hypothetical protein
MSFHVATVAVEEQMRNICYPGSKVHAPYRHPAPLYNIFPHYIINGTIFGVGGGLMNIKCVLIFPTILS